MASDLGLDGKYQVSKLPIQAIHCKANSHQSSLTPSPGPWAMGNGGGREGRSGTLGQVELGSWSAFEVGRISQGTREAQEGEVSPQTWPDKSSSLDVFHEGKSDSLDLIFSPLPSHSAAQRSCKHSKARINSACGVWDIVNNSPWLCVCLCWIDLFNPST